MVRIILGSQSLCPCKVLCAAEAARVRGAWQLGRAGRSVQWSSRRHPPEYPAVSKCIAHTWNASFEWQLPWKHPAKHNNLAYFLETFALGGDSTQECAIPRTICEFQCARSVGKKQTQELVGKPAGTPLAKRFEIYFGPASLGEDFEVTWSPGGPVRCWAVMSTATYYQALVCSWLIGS